MNRNELYNQIRIKKSYLCVGLDVDLDKIPPKLNRAADPIFSFNKRIIEATKDIAVAYKPNIAFYEAYGAAGWESLKKSVALIPDHLFKIADAKRGDIGNTAKMYAKAFFEDMNFDAITLSPYMGSDSVLPFLEYEDKTAIILGLTSNNGSQDFQMLHSENMRFFEHVLTTASKWGTADNIMFVVGATHPEMFADIRKLIPDHFLLVPGVGAQGGDLRALSESGLNSKCGLLVNSTRGIIYAGSEFDDFDVKAREAAIELQKDMQQILEAKNLA